MMLRTLPARSGFLWVFLACIFLAGCTRHPKYSLQTEAVLERLDAELSRKDRYQQWRQAQNDSLRREVARARNAGDRAWRLFAVSQNYVTYQLDSAAYYVDRLYRLAASAGSEDIRRIALLAHFVHNGFRLMADLLDAKGDEQRLRELFSVTLTGYWSNHYTFGRESQETQAALGRSSVDIVLINTVAPLYYTYAETADDYDWTERAVALLENLKPEHNHITTMFGNAGMKIDNAMVSQAVIQLRNAYCLPHKCLYCLAGHKMLAAK